MVAADHNVCAFARKGHGDGLADSASAAGGDSYVTSQAHRAILIGENRSRTYAAADATLRTAIESMMRDMPLMNMLTPTKVPMAHIELAGHCM